MTRSAGWPFERSRATVAEHVLALEVVNRPLKSWPFPLFRRPTA